MAITIIERPYEVNWSKNPVRYTLQTDTDLDTAGLYIQVAVYFSKFNANVFSEAVVLSLFPDKAGVCHVDISNILNGLIDYFIPTVDGSPEQAANQNGNFYLQYREVTDASPSQAYSQDVTRSVIKGGLSYEKWRGANYFTSYLATAKSFLTWQKSGFICNTQQPLYLYFLQLAASAGQITAKFTLHYTDGTDTDKTVNVGDGSTTPKYSLWCIPTGVAQNGLESVTAAKTIYWYEVSVSDNSGLLVAAYRYYPDYRFFDRIFEFNFINSLGGIDAIRILGQWEQEQERKYDAIERYNETYFLNDNRIDPRISQGNASEKISYKGNAGFIEDPAVLDAYRDLMLSSRVMQLMDSRWLFVLMTADKTSLLFKKREGLYNLAVEWRYSFDNRNYTPMAAAIGGIMACAVPTNFHLVSSDATSFTVGWTPVAGNVNFIIELEGTKHTIDPPGPVQPSTYPVSWYIDGSTGGNTYTIAKGMWVDMHARMKAVCAASSSNYTNTLTLL